ncbi:hypothetical protein MGYG_01970 [Nannizzia gypsea CBS 118893]|uniref:Uncharacterized protein n=1 Tax=Arthroderma gypseum (strain ATCC MYA-4604 / CBS 118893) TaxID=535722 RepID=E5QZ49_ARTGP|nr:hypothetical protein MGYG_01970 [Nannizzia gypsea CBS 118893]EFQ98958.1 hypothetical protein MGYG_01970 [Nannizzia gypsea CBS 118893]
MLEERSRFLAGLPQDTNEYRYLGQEHAEMIVKREYTRFVEEHKSPYVIFTHVPPSEIDMIDNRSLGKLDYHHSLRILLANMPCLPHEEALSLFGNLVLLKANKMQVDRLIRYRAATTTKTRERDKEGDISWAPRWLPPGRSKQWPTVALEVGYSESREKIKHDIAWWLYSSNGDVLMAVSIDIKRTSGNIYITLWERGVMPTRNHPNPDPKVVGEVKLFRGKNGRPARVEGADLVVPFKYILLRSPDRSQGEGDFTFTKAELLQLAETIWEDMD